MSAIFEHRSQKPLPLRSFWIRLGRYVLAAVSLFFVSLGVGMIGYHSLENMNWLDSFFNASMIRGGMGPAAELTTDGGKVVAGLVFGPLIHRLLHMFHFEIEA